MSSSKVSDALKLVSLWELLSAFLLREQSTHFYLTPRGSKLLGMEKAFSSNVSFGSGPGGLGV